MKTSNPQGDKVMESTRDKLKSIFFFNMKNWTALKATIYLNSIKNPMAAKKMLKNPNSR